jgi:hypothetical protein
VSTTYTCKNRFIEISESSYGGRSFLLSSKGENDDKSCTLTISGFGKYIIIYLPDIIKPKAEKVTPTSWDAATVKRLGRDYYYNYIRRVYGFSSYEGHVSLHYGLCTDCSSSEQRIGFFLPWTQWKFVRRTIFNSDGTLHGDFPATKKGELRDWHVENEATQTVKKDTFLFADYDGEQILADCYIEEREWTRGDSWCSWLKYFHKPQIRRSMDISFSSEVGKRKGSWKGGTLGQGIEMPPYGDCLTAFLRYCTEHNLKYIKIISKDTVVPDRRETKHIEDAPVENVKVTAKSS